MSNNNLVEKLLGKINELEFQAMSSKEFRDLYNKEAKNWAEKKG